MDASLMAILAIGVSLAALVLAGQRSLRTEFRDRFEELRDGNAGLRDEMTELRTELRDEMTELRTELRTEIAELRTELRAEMAKFRTEVRAEIGELRTEVRAEIGELRTEVREGFAAASVERQEIRRDVQSLAERVARLEGAIPFLSPRRKSSPPPVSAA